MDCTICTETKNKQEFVILRCDHHLCKDCLDKLLRNQCPFCRKEIFSKEDNKKALENSNEILPEEDQIDYILPDSTLDNSVYLDNFYDDDIIFYSFFSRKLNNKHVKKYYNDS